MVFLVCVFVYVQVDAHVSRVCLCVCVHARVFGVYLSRVILSKAYQIHQSSRLVCIHVGSYLKDVVRACCVLLLPASFYYSLTQCLPRPSVSANGLNTRESAASTSLKYMYYMYLNNCCLFYLPTYRLQPFKKPAIFSWRHGISGITTKSVGMQSTI